MPDAAPMPPVPCPDCMHPTTFDEDAFVCSNCGQVFSTPNGMDLSMWQELWRAWTAGRAAVEYRHEVDYLADQLRQYVADPEVVVRLLAAIDEREREYNRCAEELREAARAKVRLPHTEFLRATVSDGLRLCQAHRDIVAEWQEAQTVADGLSTTLPDSVRQAAHRLAGRLFRCVLALARGYGVEDGETK